MKKLMAPLSRSGMEAHLLRGLPVRLQGSLERVPLLCAGREAVELVVARVHQNRKRVTGLGEIRHEVQAGSHLEGRVPGGGPLLRTRLPLAGLLDLTPAHCTIGIEGVLVRLPGRRSFMELPALSSAGEG